MKTKKRFLGIAQCALVAGWMVLGGAWALAQEAKPPVEITYWYAFTGKIQECNVNLVQKFNDTVGQAKGIKVTAEYQGDYNAVHQKLQAAYVAGNPPDVSVVEIASMGGFALNGVLRPLDDLIQKDKWDIKDFQQGLMGNSVIKGKIYGFPYLRSTPILYMNTTLLKKAGLDPAGPKTWDEFAQYAKAIKEKTGVFGATLSTDIWLFEGFMIQAGTTVLNDAETKCLIDGKAAKDQAQFFKDLKDKDFIRMVSGADAAKVTADIMSQNCAMWFGSTAGMTTNLGIAKDNGFELNTCFMPKKVRYGTPTGGCNLVITTKSTKERQAAAWEFLKWMTDRDQTVYQSAYLGYMPNRVSAVNSQPMQDLYKVRPQFKVAVDQLAFAQRRAITPTYAEATKLIVAALDAVWVNNQDVGKIFDDTAKRVTALLSD